MAKKENSNVKEAMDIANIILMDPRERQIYEEIEKARLNYNTAVKHAENKGMTKGKELGIKEGIAIANKENAKKMKEQGIDINTIEKCTGLSKEEIEAL